MTANQIAYMSYLENKRANLAREGESVRHNIASEKENIRHNQQTEQLGVLNFGESQRHNLETESLSLKQLAEAGRHNLVAEGLESVKLDETNRANLAKEAETERSNRTKEEETERSNRAKEAETHRHNLWSEGVDVANASTGIGKTLLTAAGIGLAATAAGKSGARLSPYLGAFVFAPDPFKEGKDKAIHSPASKQILIEAQKKLKQKQENYVTIDAHGTQIPAIQLNK